ncbi:copper amine oxidase N-terminal domain-containing protein [Paenibacillus hexagrammi]|uniref:Copper amine oxidase N-terminal domain-containing protein n=1 Tax=Paenibacillus hexagrammi TaxID=2908839 RepID=A0ABY3SG45_9BACL|nr:copper amine oxidase N-terminal domain-containing protein [Paenibacillus sp. YPD9-1]UJF32428.1 copper amine oxidase N-terminal domain-containing protein [Paenibacillus sp. YPD9-1]
MKSWKKIAVISMVVFAVALPGAASAEESMMAGYDYTKVNTIMKDGMELVPLREIAESLGYQVIWGDENRSITINDKKDMMMDDSMKDKTMDGMMEKGHSWMLQIGSTSMKDGEAEVMLEVAPMIVNDMTYVPKEVVDQHLLQPMMMK